jgi:hypothetical protein
MGLNQSEDESHLLHPTKNNISSQSGLANQYNQQKPEVRQPSIKRRWIWVAIAILIVIVIMLVISLINSRFGSSIGYQILISILASTLACLLGVSIVEIINMPRKGEK